MVPHAAIAHERQAGPANFASYRGIHAGQAIVVCGCGSSLSEFGDPARFITIGVNDVGRLFQPDYLVVLNARGQFHGDRFRYVEESRARAIFTQLDLGLLHLNIIRFRLGLRAGTDFDDPNALNYTRNSPYVAVCLAVHMGARRIGIVGVDFTDHHFFGSTGRHPLASEFAQIDREYTNLRAACAQRGVELYNLSSHSRLTGIPKIQADTFAAMAQEDSPLKIVSYATTPVAGVPVILSRCIVERTPHTCRTVWARNSYGNGVKFAGDVEWESSPDEAHDLIREADVIIAHNGKIAPQHRKLAERKSVITLAHNYMWNVDQTWVSKGLPGVVVGQYQATLSEFRGWAAVPNPIPLWDPAFSPGPKGDTITISYTPSGKHEQYSPDHKLYWHSKGYETTIGILDRLAKRYPIHLEVIRDVQVSHAASMAMKQRAHIVIDECVTGSYHRNSLEGLACGCVVVNGVGIAPGIGEVFKTCSTGEGALPFVKATLASLEEILADLIGNGAEKLAQMGQVNRTWMEKHWDFSQQWRRFWWPALTLAQSPMPPRVHLQSSEPNRELPRIPYARQTSGGVSVIVPFGGAERLRNLEATLSNVQTCAKVHELIVVEMDSAPHAREIAAASGAAYVLIRSETPFHKARAMNVGIPFSASDRFLWLDSDILLPPDFLEKGLQELNDRQLDSLTPWTCVRYLSASDSDQVASRAKRTQDCCPVNTYYTRRGCCGGAVLVRTEFARRYGGICEQFRGWGGEDNAWLLRVNVLGRGGVTNLQNQTIFHLYHLGSGGYGPAIAINSNPCYKDNLNLLNRIRQLRTPDRMLEAFPSPPCFVPPWSGQRRIGVSAVTSLIGHELRRLYGDAITLCNESQSPDYWVPEEFAQQGAQEAALETAKRISLLGASGATVPKSIGLEGACVSETGTRP